MTAEWTDCSLAARAIAAQMPPSGRDCATGTARRRPKVWILRALHQAPAFGQFGAQVTLMSTAGRIWAQALSTGWITCFLKRSTSAPSSGRALVDRDVGHLLEDVVEARRPLARAEARRGRAVVDHVGDAARVHVGVERVDRTRSPTRWRPPSSGWPCSSRMSICAIIVRDVDAGRERVTRDLRLVALGAHLLRRPSTSRCRRSCPSGCFFRRSPARHDAADLVAARRPRRRSRRRTSRAAG